MDSITLRLHGYLNFYAPGRQSRLNWPLPQPTPLAQVLQAAGVSLPEVALVAINGTVIPLEEAIARPGDEIDAWSPISGG